MREIKFDWMREIDGKWHHKIMTMPYIDTVVYIEELNTEFKTKHGIFREYTGLKDKNGKEIYEGDILMHNPDDDEWYDAVFWWDEQARFELKSFVNFDLESMAERYRNETGSFGDPMDRARGNRDATMLKLADWVYGSSNPSLIVGNIYDNPELLGE